MVGDAETAWRKPAAAGSDKRAPVAGPRASREMTLHQLRIFWAVAHAETLTKAAKQLGLTQPSLSQQLSKLEATVGTPLFNRTPVQMTLTDAGRFLLRKAEYILSNIEEAEDGLRAFGKGARASVRVAGINSVLRVLLPPALREILPSFPGIELDIHEVAPAEALELLYGRRVNVGLVASNSVPQASVGFHQSPVAEDPYVLAVPAGLSLAGISDPEAQLGQAEQAVLNNCIQFTFGTQHTRVVEEWYGQVLPHHRLIAACRNYDVALAMVQAGLGVCLVPAFTALSGAGGIENVDLYRATGPSRRIVALLPSQYHHVELYSQFVAALRKVGSEIGLPPMADTPPFLHRATDESSGGEGA
jgi:DNA-binding transcriptional LysR family regulator